MAESRLEQLSSNLHRLVTMQTAMLAMLEETVALIDVELQTLPYRSILDADPSESPSGWTQPYVDKSLLAVVYRGRECFLGNTLSLRLFERLLRRPNQYLDHRDLLDHVWFGVREPSSIRSVVKELRAKLRNAGMADLSAAIDGRVAGHYGLILNKLP